MAEIARKSALSDFPPEAQVPQDIQNVVSAYFLEWADYQVLDGVRPNLPPEALAALEGQPAEAQYEAALLSWLQDLAWPVRPVQDEICCDVTYLELFVCFSMQSCMLPPHRINTDSGPTWVSFDSDAGLMQPDSSQRMIDRFLYHVRKLETCLKRDLFSGSRSLWHFQACKFRALAEGGWARCTSLSCRC